MGSNYRYFGSLTREEMELFTQKYPGVDYKQWVKAFIKASIKGTLTPQEAENLDKEIKQQRLTKIKKEIVYLDIKIAKEAIHDLHISPSNAVALRKGEVTLELITTSPGTSFNNDHTLPKETKQTREQEYNNTAQTMPLSVWDESENQFICNSCNPISKFTYRYGVITEMMNVITEFESHLINTHGRQANDNEKKIMNEYLDWVNKKFVEKQT